MPSDKQIIEQTLRNGETDLGYGWKLERVGFNLFLMSNRELVFAWEHPSRARQAPQLLAVGACNGIECREVNRWARAAGLKERFYVDWTGAVQRRRTMEERIDNFQRTLVRNALRNHNDDPEAAAEELSVSVSTIYRWKE